MIFVLSGPWGVGKSETIKYLSDYYGFKTLIPWSTTVTSDLRGTKYNLLLNQRNGYQQYTNEQLLKIEEYFTYPLSLPYVKTEELNQKETGFWCQPFKQSGDNRVLGYRLSEIIAYSNQNAVVIEADTSVAQQLKTAAEQGFIGRVMNFFLDYESEDCFNTRLQDADYSEHERKLKKDHRTKERNFYQMHMGLFEKSFINNNVDAISREIISASLKFINSTPHMLHNMPGVLCEYDIQLSIKSGSIKVSVPERYQKTINQVLGSDVYSECVLSSDAVMSASIDLFLSPEYRIIKKGLKKQIDLMLGEETKLRELLNKNGFSGDIDTQNSDNLERICNLVEKSRTSTYNDLFESHVMSQAEGMVLQPNEIALCSSLEDFSLGNNVIAFITSKYSFSQLGLSISLNQSILQPSHKGRVMLQLRNNLTYPIVIYPYVQVAQCFFFRTISSSSCQSSQDDMFSMRYESSNAFKALSKMIIREKNWNELQHQTLKRESDDESKQSKKDKNEKIQLTVSVIGGILGFLTFIANILFKIFVP